MSIKAMHWAWEQRLPPSLKLVLMALADAADDAGQCWPSLRTLAAKCCVSERTVQRVMKDFERMGLLLVTRRFTADGRQTSNAYRLDLQKHPDKLSPSPAGCRGEGDTGVTGGVTQLCHPRGDKAMSPLEPPDEPKREPPPQPGAVDNSTLTWPEGLCKPDRQAIRMLLQVVPTMVAQQLLDELAGAMSTRGTIKTTPLRWFRALVTRMQQGRFVPTAGIRVAHKRAADAAAVAQPAPTNPAAREAALKAIAETRKQMAQQLVGRSTGGEFVALGQALKVLKEEA
jgi:hypothetical protein